MPFVEFKGDEIEFPYNMSGDEIQDVLGAIASSATATSEFMLTLGTGAIAEPVAGLAGLATGSADNVRRVQSMLTYQPRTAAGQKAMQRIGQDLASMAEETGLDNVSGYWRDRVVPALQQQAGPIAGSMLAAGGLAALTLMSEAGGGGTARGARRIGMNAQEGAIKAFHGSPHDFDQFSSANIGTGEGAQAYGHGLYFAEAEDVAQGYRQAGQGTKVKIDGNDLLSKESIDLARSSRVYSQSANYLNIHKDADQAIAAAKSDGLNDVAVEISEMNESGRISYPSDGSMFEVNIDAEPDELLDWDLPLSEQNERVQKAIRELGADKATDVIPVADELELIANNDRGLYDQLDSVELLLQDYIKSPNNKVIRSKVNRLYREYSPNYLNELEGKHGNDGAGLLDRLKSTESGGAQKAAELLKSKGIKGIRYKDGMSRGATGGTSNYVIFDDKTISIARKYGITLPAAAAMLAAQGEGDAPL